MATVSKIRTTTFYDVRVTPEELVVLQMILWNIGGTGPGRSITSDISEAIGTVLDLWDDNDIPTDEYFESDEDENCMNWIDRELPDISEINFR